MEKEISKEQIERMRKMIINLRRRKYDKRKMVSNTEVDLYYERNLKKYDTE